jgi:hypothetical protein
MAKHRSVRMLGRLKGLLKLPQSRRLLSIGAAAGEHRRPLRSTSVESKGGRELAERKLVEFVLREQIGEGGYGAVHLGEQPLLKRDVVV